jgi:hypothetical protein
MHALLALTFATALDLWRRASTRLIALASVLFILTLRYFAAFGLGYEVVQLKELGVYTLGIFGALSALLFCLPRDDSEGEAEGLFLVQPVSANTLTLGLYLGRLLVISVLLLISTGGIIGALAWFASAEPQIFSYRGQTTLLAESLSLAAPIFGQWLTLAVLLAFAQPISRARRPLLISLAFLLIYIVGFSAPALGPVARVLPDFARYDLTARLWGDERGAALPWLLLHGTCWCTVGLAVDALHLRLKSAA